MKIKSVLLTVVLVMVLLWAAPLPVNAQEEENKDNYGKVIGQLVDADTGKIIQEEFIIEFFDASHKTWALRGDQIMGTKTYKDGRFKFPCPPGEYTIVCYPAPENLSSQYTWGPDPFLFPETLQRFKVIKNKVTHVVKKVYPAGKIETIPVAPDGNRLDLATIWPKPNVNQEIFYDVAMKKDRAEYICDATPIKQTKPGESFYLNLYPGKYNIAFYFSTGSIGYGSKLIESIFVEKNNTTKVFIEIDMNDGTGLEGRIFDLQGNPHKGAKVSVESDEERKGFKLEAYAIADENGYYKIVGLEEGYYRVIVKSGAPFNLEQPSPSFPFTKVFIQRGKMLRKDVKEKQYGKK